MEVENRDMFILEADLPMAKSQNVEAFKKAYEEMSKGISPRSFVC
jgi:hypothetical protein